MPFPKVNEPTGYTHKDFPVGTQVVVMARAVDFYYFTPGRKTGIVTKSENRYLGISVEFTTPIWVKSPGGDFEKKDHNFKPEHLVPVLSLDSVGC